jgi:two-component system response regulator AtoC
MGHQEHGHGFRHGSHDGSCHRYILSMRSTTASETLQPVLIVDDEENLRHVLRLMLEQFGFVVFEARDGRHAIQVLDEHPEVRMVLCDLRMPHMDGMAFLAAVADRGLKIVMMSAYGTTATSEAALDLGAVDTISKPFRPAEIRLRLERLMNEDALEVENTRLRAAVGGSGAIEGFVGQSAPVQKVIELILKVAPYPTTVLITGESGTGKEVLARATHAHSNRSEGPFVAVNCGAIPESLLESELFGHERGAFTGAVRAHQGLFEQAHRGTLLLDEIGEMPIALQTRLLRVLEAGTVRRVGGQKDRKIDVRVVAATARNLVEMAEEKRFRDDLLYRLRVVHIEVPSLRERTEDIPLLVSTLSARAAERLGREVPQIDEEAMRVLLRHPWPGNVRELENAIERAMLMGDGATILARDLPEPMSTSGSWQGSVPDFSGDDLSIKRHTASLERMLIQRALERTEGNRSQASRLLDISYKALVYKIRGYGLDGP